MKEIERIKELINESDAIVIGAGAGLSTAAGFEYGGSYFLENFPDIYKKYGYTDMYSAGFHPFLTSEERWGYWCRFIYLQRYKEGAKPLYKKLYEMIKDKNYFVITTNVDHQFQLSGFSKDRLFYTQGDYGLFQCSKPCHQKTYDNKEQIMEMIHSLKEGLIPASLIPKCPICGEEMTMNLRSDDNFVEDEGWHTASHNYEKFLSENKNKKILFLELGVGWNTPAIIKYPFMRMTHYFKNAFYVCINKGFNRIPEIINDKSIVLNADINVLMND
ncbi:MAG: Sir2 silent information regulator family NAD-dependent deacetylase [Gammaproteobacteria bacterium]|nr:Sir2 silent information regulator family NAD-dependent deacetylase [Gammaproteobacteria bacterium]